MTSRDPSHLEPPSVMVHGSFMDLDYANSMRTYCGIAFWATQHPGEFSTVMDRNINIRGGRWTQITCKRCKATGHG